MADTTVPGETITPAFPFAPVCTPGQETSLYYPISNTRSIASRTACTRWAW